MKPRTFAGLALGGWFVLLGYFLLLAAALIISGASLSDLTIHDIGETVLRFWPDFIVYLAVSIICGYLVAVLKRKASVTPDDPRLKGK